MMEFALSVDSINKHAKAMRRHILTMAVEGGTSHVGSALSCTDILAVLYFQVMNTTPENWENSQADKFILSKGHGVKAWYAVLAQRGFLSVDELKTYAKDGSFLGEHPVYPSVKGITCATGSLGHGLPVAGGIALARKINKDAGRVFVLLSDGECNEGSVWEAAMFAAHRQLDNLTVIVDDNQWQALGRSREVSALEPFGDKWESFGWETAFVNGHDTDALGRALTTGWHRSGCPKALIARTCLGKGVSFMEDDLLWHYQIPSKDQLHQALVQLE